MAPFCTLGTAPSAHPAQDILHTRLGVQRQMKKQIGRAWLPLLCTGADLPTCGDMAVPSCCLQDKVRAEGNGICVSCGGGAESCLCWASPETKDTLSDSGDCLPPLSSTGAACSGFSSDMVWGNLSEASAASPVSCSNGKLWGQPPHPGSSPSLPTPQPV